MNTVELIRKKRNGLSLSKSEIQFLIDSYLKKRVPDYQFSAFLMAVYFKGMTEEEQSALVNAMISSGIIVDLKNIKGIKVDKHSTGGVGDKTSLIIAPIAAAAGVKVPMISGRGLGHSGGTLDKLESIPGFRTNLALSEYKNVLRKCGAVLIGQTKEIAPADKLIYALRDVTATVESIPLITGSIMSKKIAEGIDGLVLDVKTGSGAFMSDEKDAVKLADALIRTAKSFDKKVIAFITDMNQPLGNYIGNWFEVYESIKVLQGENVPDLLELSLCLAGAMIYLGNKAASIEEGKEKSLELIRNGKAFGKFVEIVKYQKGNVKYLHNPELYPKSKFSEKIIASQSGYLSAINTYEIGMAALELGAGRLTKKDKIDPKAGIIFYPKIGNQISRDDVIAEVFTDNKEKMTTAKNKILSSLTISRNKISKLKLIKKIII
jgi:pyrimidine-nucleoside phosphorylase